MEVKIHMKLKRIIIALLVVLLCTGVVFAAETEYKSPSENIVTLVPYEAPSGTLDVNAVIKNINNNDEVVDYVKVVVTDISQKDTAVSVKITNLLDTAYNQIVESEHIDDMIPQDETSVIEYMQQTFPKFDGIKDLTEDDIYISDVFDVSIVSSNGDLLNVPGYVVEFRLSSPIEEGEIFAVMHNYEADKWRIEEDVELKGDVLTVKVDKLSCFAIVRNKGKTEPLGPIVNEEPKSNANIPLIFILGCITGILIVYYSEKKKSKVQEHHHHHHHES